MARPSFSLTEKLAVTGAFLAIVAMVVGTEKDPGVVAASVATVGPPTRTTSEDIPAVQLASHSPAGSAGIFGNLFGSKEGLASPGEPELPPPPLVSTPSSGTRR